MRRIKRLRCRHWRLLGATLALTVCLTTGSSLAADLVIDGATYTIDSDVSFNNVYIGNVSTGTLNQTGGTNTENGNLYLGYSSGSSGTYNLSGGANTVAGILFLGFNSGSSGTYNLSGGSLSAGFGFVGYQGARRLQPKRRYLEN